MDNQLTGEPSHSLKVIMNNFSSARLAKVSTIEAAPIVGWENVVAVTTENLRQTLNQPSTNSTRKCHKEATYQCHPNLLGALNQRINRRAL